MTPDLPLTAVDLFDALPDATCLVDWEGRILSANVAARELLGLAADAVEFPCLQELCREADRPIIDRIIYRTLRFAEHDTISCEQVRSGGETLSLSLSAHECRNPAIAVLVLRPRVAGSQEREWLEEQVRLHYRRGEQMHQMAIRVGHNLKVPLVTMEANLVLMEEAIAAGRNEEAVEELADLKAAVLRFRGMMDELLELGRLRRYDLTTLAGQEEASPVSLDDLIAETMRLMAADISRSRARIEIQSSLPRVRARRRVIVEIYQNLISNALKFGDTAEQPVIQIGAERRPEGLVAFVRDNGPGIAAADRERVFQLFVRLNDRGSGAGAGLAIVRRILLAMQSKVWVEEGIGGQGSSICFTLPFVEDEP